MAKWVKGQSGNPKGKPKGARNKLKLAQAQVTVDEAMIDVVRMFRAISTRNQRELEMFGLTVADITPKLMMEAGKNLKDMGWSKNMVIEQDQPKAEKPDKITGTFQRDAKPVPIKLVC